MQANVDGLSGTIRRAGASALVVVARSSRDPFMAPFTGGARLGECLLVCPAAGPPHLAYLTPLEREEAASTGLALLSPESLDIARFARDGAPASDVLTAVLERALQHCGLAPGTLLLGGYAPAGTLAVAARRLSRDGWNLLDGSAAVRAWRKTKNDRDLEEIRHVSNVAGEAFRALASDLAGADVVAGVLHSHGAPIRVGSLRSAIARRFAGHGLDQPEGNLIAAGRAGAVPHNTGDDGHEVRSGESLIVDLFPRGRLFTDITRTFCVGACPDVLSDAHEAVLGALGAAKAAGRPGLRAFDLQVLVCERFRAAGYPNAIDDPGTERGYVHGLGHGVGYEVHEQPSFRRNAGEEGRLAAGDVFTLEPGLYDPVAGYAVRLEDTCHLGTAGIETLTPLPYDLDPASW